MPRRQVLHPKTGKAVEIQWEDGKPEPTPEQINSILSSRPTSISPPPSYWDIPKERGITLPEVTATAPRPSDAEAMKAISEMAPEEHTKLMRGTPQYGVTDFPDEALEYRRRAMAGQPGQEQFTGIESLLIDPRLNPGLAGVFAFPIAEKAALDRIVRGFKGLGVGEEDVRVPGTKEEMIQQLSKSAGPWMFSPVSPAESGGSKDAAALLASALDVGVGGLEALINPAMAFTPGGATASAALNLAAATPAGAKVMEVAGDPLKAAEDIIRSRIGAPAGFTTGSEQLDKAVHSALGLAAQATIFKKLFEQMRVPSFAPMVEPTHPIRSWMESKGFTFGAQPTLSEVELAGRTGPGAGAGKRLARLLTQGVPGEPLPMSKYGQELLKKGELENVTALSPDAIYMLERGSGRPVTLVEQTVGPFKKGQMLVGKPGQTHQQMYYENGADARLAPQLSRNLGTVTEIRINDAGNIAAFWGHPQDFDANKVTGLLYDLVQSGELKADAKVFFNEGGVGGVPIPEIFNTTNKNNRARQAQATDSGNLTAMEKHLLNRWVDTGDEGRLPVVVAPGVRRIAKFLRDRYAVRNLQQFPIEVQTNTHARGSDITPVGRNYDEAAANTPADRNVWVRQADTPENQDRTLMVQFSSKLLLGEATKDVSEQYYDRLYQNRPGYNRTEDFWEIPFWMAQVGTVARKSDVYVVRNIAEAQEFLKKAGYGKMAFSALDVNKDFIKQLVEANPETRTYVGGYVQNLRDEFMQFPNVKTVESVEQFAKELGVQYLPDYDYRHFRGTAVIPRLQMSTGCRYKCAFCTIPKGVKDVAPEIIDRQVDAIKDLKAKLVYLDDKTFGQAPNYQRLSDIYEQVKKSNPEFEGFIVQTTAPDLLKMPDEWLARSGIKYVEIGVESFNDNVLSALHKPSREASIEAATEKLRRAKIALIPNIMIGLRGKDAKGVAWEETPETYARTMDYLNRNQDVISHVNAYNLAIYDGTELANQVDAKLDANLKNENILNASAYQNPQAHQQFHDEVMRYGIEQLDKEPTFTRRVPATEGALPVSVMPGMEGVMSFIPGSEGRIGRKIRGAARYFKGGALSSAERERRAEEPLLRVSRETRLRDAEAEWRNEYEKNAVRWGRIEDWPGHRLANMQVLWDQLNSAREAVGLPPKPKPGIFSEVTPIVPNQERADQLRAEAKRVKENVLREYESNYPAKGFQGLTTSKGANLNWPESARDEWQRAVRMEQRAEAMQPPSEPTPVSTPSTTGTTSGERGEHLNPDYFWRATGHGGIPIVYDPRTQRNFVGKWGDVHDDLYDRYSSVLGNLSARNETTLEARKNTEGSEVYFWGELESHDKDQLADMLFDLVQRHEIKKDADVYFEGDYHRQAAGKLFQKMLRVGGSDLKVSIFPGLPEPGHGFEQAWENLRKYAGSINTNLLKVDEDAKRRLHQDADRVRPMMEQEFGKSMTDQEIIDMVRDAKPFDQVLTGEMQKQVAAEVLRLRQVLAAGAGEARPTRQYYEDFLKLQATAKFFGRMLQKFNIEAEPVGRARVQGAIDNPLAGKINEMRVRILKQMSDLNLDMNQVIDRAQYVDWNNTNQVGHFYREFVKPTGWELLNELRYINMLSSPKTHVINFTSNMAQATVLAPATKLVAGAVDLPLRILGRGSAQGHYMREAGQFMVGAFKGFPEGVRNAADVMRGRTPIERFDLTHMPSMGQARSKFLIPLAKFNQAFSFVSKAMEASDRFWQAIAGSGELRAAIKKAQYRGEPVDLLALHDQAMEIAKKWMFRDPLDPKNETGQGLLLSMIDNLSRTVMRARSMVRGDSLPEKLVGGVANFFMPFVATPMNILKRGIEYSPLGFVTMIKNADKVEAFSRSMIGSSVFAGTAALIANMETTWEIPRDPGKKADWDQAGKIPYAIKIGGKWYQYSKLGPLAYPIALAAAWKEYSNDPRYQNVGSRIMQGISGYAKFFADQSYVQGLADFAEVIQGEATSIEATVSNFARQTVPLVALQGWVNQMLDPKKRIPTDPLERVATGLPGVSSKLTVRQTPLGEEAKRPSASETWLNLSPVAIGVTPDDPLVKAVDRYGIEIGLPSKKVFGTVLDEPTYQKYVAEVGKRIRERIADIVLDPDFGSRPRMERQEEIDETVRAVRKEVRDDMFSDLREQAGEQKAVEEEQP